MPHISNVTSAYQQIDKFEVTSTSLLKRTSKINMYDFLSMGIKWDRC